MIEQPFSFTNTIKDAFVLLFYRLTSFIPVSKKIRDMHLEYNNSAWSSYMQRYSNEIYIEHQQSLSELLYGKKYTADYNSCEVIAVYNALLALQMSNMKHSPHDNTFDGQFHKDVHAFPILLNFFEKKGITCNGAFGTSPFSLIKYMCSQEMIVTSYRYRRWRQICSHKADNASNALADEYNQFVEGHDVFIFMAYNNSQSIRDMIHTMCVTKEGKHFQTHNDYEGAKCYPTLQAAVDGYKGGRSRVILVMGIRKL